VKAYRASNPERWKEYQRDWTKANREKRNAVEKRWRAKNPEIYRQHLANQKANRRGAPGKVSPKEWQLIKEMYEFTCPSCGLREPQIKLQRDHIIPVKLGGLNIFQNIQPLCLACNVKKGSTIRKFEPINNETRRSETDSKKV
jgi:5-methylcytosine-specific restriction endonuclease McrA